MTPKAEVNRAASNDETAPPEFVFPDAAPVACTEPEAPEERVTAIPEIAGGLVVLSFVSMYASDNGLFRQFTTGLMVRDGE